MNTGGPEPTGEKRFSEEIPDGRQPQRFELQPAVIPPPTYWPMVLAFAASIMLLGLVTSYFFTAAGFPLLVLALYHWIKEMR